MKQLKMIPVRVEWYSGYRSDEYPKCFYVNNEKIEIEEIIDRWYQGENNPQFPVSNYYKVICGKGDKYLLKHEVEKDLWYLCI